MRETTGNNQSQPSSVSRDAESLNVGDCLVVDGKVLDFTILHPETGKPVQMILIVMIDWASRCPVGWQLMPTANTIGIKAAFRGSAINLGKYPKAVYLDTGKAIISKFMEEDLGDFDSLFNLFDSVGTAAHFKKPYNSSTKVTEHFFNTVRDNLECLMPSYCGDAVHLKQAHMNRNQAFLKAWNNLRPESYAPTIQEASKVIGAYIEWLSRQPRKILDGRTSLDVLETGRGAGIDPSQCHHDFLWRAFRSARRCRVKLQGITYESDCLHGLDPRVDIQVNYDTSDLSTIYCYLLDGEYLGEAHLVPREHPLVTLAKDMADESIMEHVTKGLKQRARLQKNAKDSQLKLGSRWVSFSSDTPGNNDI